MEPLALLAAFTRMCVISLVIVANTTDKQTNKHETRTRGEEEARSPFVGLPPKARAKSQREIWIRDPARNAIAIRLAEIMGRT